MPALSIITVCRNERDTIRQTCESVVGQTFTDFEWIVIDGRSTDGTLEILAEYRNQICHLISEPDAGIYDAMNKGIRLAAGEYLLFLNGGDCLADRETLGAVVPELDSDIVYGDQHILSRDGSINVKRYPDSLPRNFLLKNMMPHQSVFLRRRLFEQYGLYNTFFKVAGDYDVFVRLLHVHRVSCRHVRRVISVFRTDGISCDKTRRMLRKLENHHIRKKYFPIYQFGFKSLKMEFRIRLLGAGNA